MALLYSIGQLILGVYPKFHMNQSLGLTDLIMEQHLPFSHLVLTTNIKNYKNTKKTKSTTPINTGGGTIESHFWIELPLKFENQTIQIKVLVPDSECPYDILIGRTSLVHLSAWQDYATNFTYSKFPSQ